MEEDDIQGRKGAQPRQSRQFLLAPSCRSYCLCLARRTRIVAASRRRNDLKLCAQAVTSEPTFSPEMTRRILPG